MLTDKEIEEQKIFEQGFDTATTRLIDALNNYIIKPETIIEASALYSLIVPLSDCLSDAGLAVEKEMEQFEKKIKGWASELNAKTLEMYDPQRDPHTGELQKDGSSKLFVWDEI